MEVVVQMFQRLGLRFVLLTRHGVLRGILTKMVRMEFAQPAAWVCMLINSRNQDLHEHIDGDADSEFDDR